MIRRHAYVIGLFFLAPLVGEFLLGNLPIFLLPLVVVLAPMYGGGALLVRELARRRGLGWPNMLILALAYAVIEEGLTTQSLFNPNYADEHLLQPGYIPAFGIGTLWTIYVLGIHVFWSIGAPILLMESIAREKRTTPWLGRRGLIITGVLFLIGCGISVAINMAQWPYTSSAAQFASAGVLVVLLIAAGLFLRIGTRPDPAHIAPHPAHIASGADHTAPGAGRTAPGAVTVLIATLVAGALFEVPTLGDLPTWLGVTSAAVGIIGYLALIAFWSAGEGWGDLQRLAIGAGALITYVWHAFAARPDSTGGLIVELVGSTIMAIATFFFLRYTYRRVTRRAVVETA